jgi:hypothetical protein
MFLLLLKSKLFCVCQYSLQFLSLSLFFFTEIYYVYLYACFFSPSIVSNILRDSAEQGRIQDRRQPMSGYPFGSLKNKYYMIKNNFFYSNILFIWTGHPLSIFSDSAPGAESCTSTSSQHLLKKEDPDTSSMPFFFSIRWITLLSIN